MNEVVVMTNEQLSEFASSVAEKVLSRQAPAQLPEFLTVDEACRELGISRATLHKIRQKPGFPEVHYCDSPRFPRADLLQWAKRQNEK